MNVRLFNLFLMLLGIGVATNSAATGFEFDGQNINVQHGNVEVTKDSKASLNTIAKEAKAAEPTKAIEELSEPATLDTAQQTEQAPENLNPQQVPEAQQPTLVVQPVNVVQPPMQNAGSSTKGHKKQTNTQSKKGGIVNQHNKK